MWKHSTPGIPDELFERIEEVPITKEEVRVIQISKARLSPGQIVYDIGCGSGSVSIEAALQVKPTGKVSSIDVTQITVSKSRKTSTGTMMLARNPVTVISATKI